MITTKLIKLADGFLGPILLKIMPGARSIPIQYPLKKILVIRPGGMGDGFLLLPVLKHINQYRHVTIDILCEPRNRPAFDHCAFINRVFSYRKPSSFLKIFKFKYDAVVDTEQSYILSALTARFVHAPAKLGFDTFNRKHMFTHAIKYPSIYEANAFWNLFDRLFNFKTSFALTPPYLNGSAEKNNLYASVKNIICFFPGATTRERHWPTERWAAVCDFIASKGYTPVLIGGKTEERKCSEISKFSTTKRLLNFCSQLSISQTVDLFKSTELLISTDSGILHLGVVCNLPTISIFGPSDPVKWGPRGHLDQILNRNIDCSPCAQFGTIPTCPNNNKCMLSQTPEEVIACTLRLINTNQPIKDTLSGNRNS